MNFLALKPFGIFKSFALILSGVETGGNVISWRSLIRDSKNIITASHLPSVQGDSKRYFPLFMGGAYTGDLKPTDKCCIHQKTPKLASQKFSARKARAVNMSNCTASAYATWDTSMCNLLFNIPGRPCQREKIEWFWLADVDKLGNRNLYQPTNEYE